MSTGFLSRFGAVVLALQVACLAAAQDSDSPYFAPAFSELPADLRSYLSAIATNTAVAAAIVGDYVTEPEDGPDGSRGPAYSEAVPFIQGAQSRFQQAATATRVPDDQRTVLISIASVLNADAATDGLLGSAPTSTVSKTGMTTAATRTSDAVTSATTDSASIPHSSQSTTSQILPVSSATTQATATTKSNGATNARPGLDALLCSSSFLALVVFAAVVQ